MKSIETVCVKYIDMPVEEERAIPVVKGMAHWEHAWEVMKVNVERVAEEELVIPVIE